MYYFALLQQRLHTNGTKKKYLCVHNVRGVTYKQTNKVYSENYMAKALCKIMLLIGSN